MFSVRSFARYQGLETVKCGYCRKEMSGALGADTCVAPLDPTIVADESLVPENLRRSVSRCRDCNVAPGGTHHPGCDTELCSVCRGQAISGCVHVCSVSYDDSPDNPDTLDLGATGYKPEEIKAAARHDPTKARWTGIWPGVLECRERGFFVRIIGPDGKLTDNFRAPGTNYVPCGPDDEGAREDLNRLDQFRMGRSVE